MRLSDLARSLVIQTSVYRALPQHVAAFCRYLIPEDRRLLSKHAGLVDDSRSYQSIAAAGYALADTELERDQAAAFESGMDRLSGRVFFAEGRTPRFEVDGIALLGIALGAKASRMSAPGHAWFQSLLTRSAEALKWGTRDGDLVAVARGVIDADHEASVRDVRLRIAFSATPGPDVRQAAWSEMVVRAGDGDPVEIAINRAVWSHCADALATMRIVDAGVCGLIGSLEGLTQSMSHWTYETAPRVKGRQPQHWEIEHEYHVQNLLWTVLRPLWTDLVDEQSLPKIGHKTPRFDLGVPSLQTIVEVKFMRSAGSVACRKVTEEIAADRSLYLAPNSGYDKLVVFIWDNCRQTEEHHTLRAGLESLEGIEKVVILSRPSRMGD